MVASLKRRSARGFILLYVLVMIAALALIIAAMQRIRPPSSEGLERELAQAVQGIESRALLDYVLASLNAEKVVLDPRYDAYQKLLFEKQSEIAAADDRIAFLKELLKSLNYDLNIDEGLGLTKKRDLLTRKEGSAKEPKAKPKEDPRLENRFGIGKDSVEVRLGEITYRVSVHPSNARPNINRLPLEMLERYLAFLKLPPDRARSIAAAIVDWRDDDDFLTPGGAESEHYLTLEPRYRARNALIRNWQELAYVRDIDSSTLRTLRENFSLDGSGYAVHVDYVTTAQIAALAGVTEAVVKTGLEHHEHAGTDSSRVDLAEILLSADAVRFESATTWTPDSEIVIINISSPQFIRTVRYDTKRKKILGEG